MDPFQRKQLPPAGATAATTDKQVLGILALFDIESSFGRKWETEVSRLRHLVASGQFKPFELIPSSPEVRGMGVGDEMVPRCLHLFKHENGQICPKVSFELATILSVIPKDLCVPDAVQYFMHSLKSWDLANCVQEIVTRGLVDETCGLPITFDANELEIA